MSGYDLGRSVLGVKTESVAGVFEPLTAPDYDVEFFDADILQLSPDTAPTGKIANGSLINTAKIHTRSIGGTGAVKIELLQPLEGIKPNYAKVVEAGGCIVEVIESGVDDNYQIVYNGKPSCATLSVEGAIEDCDLSTQQRTLRGAVISGGAIAMESGGAPFVFTGTFSGAYDNKIGGAAKNVTVSTDPCIIGTGALFSLGGTVYNVTKFSYNLNTSAGVVPDTSAVDGTNIGYYKLGGAGSGDPTLTFSAVAVSAQVAERYAKFKNSSRDTLVIENDQAKMIISDIQFTDIQSSDESGVLIDNIEIKCGAMSLQFKTPAVG